MQKAIFIEDKVLFSPDIPDKVNRLLQAAVIESRHNKETAEELFIEAHQADLHCLQTYFALYKFYFYQARLQEAEQWVMAGMKEAARQGRFPFDYYLLASEKHRWDLYADENTLFYLYTLKALAFIKLRQNHFDDADKILAVMKQLDPEDRSGASVIMDLSEAFNDD